MIILIPPCCWLRGPPALRLFERELGNNAEKLCQLLIGIRQASRMALCQHFTNSPPKSFQAGYILCLKRWIHVSFCSVPLLLLGSHISLGNY
jgi:hypothetical protein